MCVSSACGGAGVPEAGLEGGSQAPPTSVGVAFVLAFVENKGSDWVRSVIWLWVRLEGLPGASGSGSVVAILAYNANHFHAVLCVITHSASVVHIRNRK